MAASELMQMEANEGNEAIRLRAASLLALSAAALVLPAVWRPATATSSAADPTGLLVVAAGWLAWALTRVLRASPPSGLGCMPQTGAPSARTPTSSTRAND